MRPRSPGFALAGLSAAGRALLCVPRPLALVPVLSWMGLIWWLSSLSSAEGPPSWTGGFITNLAHAPLFGLLALWLILLLPREQGWPRLDARGIGLVLGFVLAYAVLDELHQARSPGRSPSPYDVLTDGVGAACVLWIAGYLRTPGAGERGLLWRLAVGVLLCLVAAALATYEPFLFPGLQGSAAGGA